MGRLGTVAFGFSILGFCFAGCSASSGGGGGGAQAGFGGGGSGGGTGSVGNTGGGINVGGGVNIDGGGTGGTPGGDPKTCAEASAAKTYVGCDFWPTAVTNHVWSVFDFAVVVANAGDAPANVTIDKGASKIVDGVVAPNSLQKFYLPWDPILKGADFDSCGSWVSGTQSLRAVDGAFHLTSSVPVTVYQFNALEYQGAGGPAGKDWSSCPGNQPCGTFGTPIGCFSYSNDASLLLPSTAMTGNYRVQSQRGWSDASVSPYVAVTGTADNTLVTVKVSAGGVLSTGNGVPAGGPGQVIDFPLAKGEVVEMFGTPTTDLSGTLIQATAPVQVITGMPCVYAPFDLNTPACDHIEESVFPAETMGQHYFVTMPTGPNADTPGHIVRIFGNVDGTALTYAPTKPPLAPDTINAGQVVDLGIVNVSFEISGDHEFAVGSFQLGGSVVDPLSPVSQQKGDPAQSFMTAVEQYRTKYVFLAPDDYLVNFVDIVAPTNAQMVLDGSPVTAGSSPLAGNYSVFRAQLGPGNGGAHLLTSDQPVGIQVMGYGFYTSYQYPGGSNLGLIAPPPPPVK